MHDSVLHGVSPLLLLLLVLLEEKLHKMTAMLKVLAARSISI